MNSPTPPPPRPSGGTEKLFIWLFGGLLVLLLGYRLLFADSPPTSLPPTVAYEPAPPPAPSPQHSTARFTPPVAKQREEASDQDELENNMVATKTVEGNADNLVDLSGLDDGRSNVVEEVVTDKVYTYVEQMPRPPGGMEGLLQYIHKSIKYPALALRNQVEGKVFVNFVIGTEGQIRDVQVTKGIGAGCDEEAVRVISRMPRWEPGKQNGRLVNVSYTVPVTFTIR